MAIDNCPAPQGKVVGPETLIQRPPRALEVESAKHAPTLSCVLDAASGMNAVSDPSFRYETIALSIPRSSAKIPSSPRRGSVLHRGPHVSNVQLSANPSTGYHISVELISTVSPPSIHKSAPISAELRCRHHTRVPVSRCPGGSARSSEAGAVGAKPQRLRRSASGDLSAGTARLQLENRGLSAAPAATQRWHCEGDAIRLRLGLRRTTIGLAATTRILRRNA